MKQILLVVVLTLAIASTIYAQTTWNYPTWQGRWTEKHNERGAVEWVFNSNGTFAKVMYWGSAKSAVKGKIYKGIFTVDSTNNQLEVKFTKVINLDDDTIKETKYQEQWNLISWDNNEIIISKPITSHLDHANNPADKGNTYIKLKRTIKFIFDEPALTKN